MYDRSVNATEFLYDLEMAQVDPNSLYTYAQIAMAYACSFLLSLLCSQRRSFLRDVYARIQGVHQNTSLEKAAFFSGHDTTLLPILAALGNSFNIWPPYASLMRIELLNGILMMRSYLIAAFLFCILFIKFVCVL